MTAVNRKQKLETMLLASPNDPMLRYMLAMELDKTAEHDRSLELFDSLINDTPPYVPAFLMAGQLLVRLERLEEARSMYRTGILEAQRQGNDHAAGEMTGFLQSLDV
jgi:predicted Zn-dependent protease